LNKFSNLSDMIKPLQEIPLSGHQQRFTLIRELLEKEISVRVRVTGNSMTPFIRSGDVVVLKRVSWIRLSVGDIVFFKHPDGRSLLHRLIRIFPGTDNNLFFQTQGDNRIRCDTQIPESNLAGKVFIIERSDGRIRNLEHIFFRSTGWAISIKQRLKARTEFLLSQTT